MLSNVQIEDLIKKGLINISFFNPEKLEANHYRLCVDKVNFRKDIDGVPEVGTVDLESPYCLEPGEYIIVTIKETIKLGRGVFGDFYPASQCVEDGLILNCGRLNSFYDKVIRFGLLNASGSEFRLKQDYEIARISFTYIGADTPIDYTRKKYDVDYHRKIELLRSTEYEIEKLKEDVKKKEELKDKIKKELEK